eukprot:gene9056-biopygen33916
MREKVEGGAGLTVDSKAGRRRRHGAKGVAGAGLPGHQHRFTRPSKAVGIPSVGPRHGRVWQREPHPQCLLGVRPPCAGAGENTNTRTREATKLNEALLQDVFEAAAELGDVPCVILGDLNVEIEKSVTLMAATLSGRWSDVAGDWARARSEEPEATCFVRKTSRGTRIDHMLMRQHLADVATDVEVLRDTGLPTHRPVRVQLELERYDQEVYRPWMPKIFPVEQWNKWPKKAEAEAAKRAVERRRTAFEAAEGKGEVEQLFEAWCSAAEDYLIELRRDALLTDEAPRGRAVRLRVPYLRRAAGAPRPGRAAAAAAPLRVPLAGASVFLRVSSSLARSARSLARPLAPPLPLWAAQVAASAFFFSPAAGPAAPFFGAAFLFLPGDRAAGF